MLVREMHVSYKTTRRTVPKKLMNAREAADWIRPHIEAEVVEVMVVIVVDAKHRPLCYRVVGRGTLNQTQVHPRDVFMTAIQANGCAVILAHNHPSGEIEMSGDDMLCARRIADAGKILGIEMLDFLVIGEDSFSSMRDMGRI